jgi:hypothetical protein
MNEPEIDAETSVDSLHDDLSANFADFGAETSAEPTEKAPAADATAQPTGKPKEAASGDAEKATTTTSTTLELPKHWSDADKTLFAKAPPEIQQRWLAREAEQQRGLDTKFQEIAGFKRESAILDEMFSPLSRELELRGISRPQFIGSLLGAHKYLVAEPQKALRWLAEQYGVDISTLNEQAQSNPQRDELMREIHGLKSQVNGFFTVQQQAEHQANLGKVESFAEAKDEKGNPLHPHFDEVAADVLTLMKAGLKDLGAAYNKAVRMNDEVWTKVQAEQKASEKRATDTKRLEDINKAKRAGVTSESREAKNGSASPSTLRDDLAAGFANFAG